MRAEGSQIIRLVKSGDMGSSRDDSRDKHRWDSHYHNLGTAQERVHERASQGKPLGQQFESHGTVERCVAMFFLDSPCI